METSAILLLSLALNLAMLAAWGFTSARLIRATRRWAASAREANYAAALIAKYRDLAGSRVRDERRLTLMETRLMAHVFNYALGAQPSGHVYENAKAAGVHPDLWERPGVLAFGMKKVFHDVRDRLHSL